MLNLMTERFEDAKPRSMKANANDVVTEERCSLNECCTDMN